MALGSVFFQAINHYLWVKRGAQIPLCPRITLEEATQDLGVLGYMGSGAPRQGLPWASAASLE